MTESLLLLDGHSMAFRSFYALRPDNFRNAAGQYLNAVYGFTSTLLKMIEDHHPTHVAVAFDLPGGTFRTREYPDYKGGRAATPEEFKGQIGLIQAVLDVLGIRWLTVEDFEADDIVATLATRGEAAGWQVWVASGDKDSYQLVSDHVHVLYPMPRSAMVELDPDAIVARTGVTPAQYPDMAALVGEDADNIPGVKGVGPKTAAKWIAKYGDLEGILANAADIRGKAGEALRASEEQVRLNRRINQSVRDLPIVADLEELRPTGVERERMHALFDSFDFTGLRRRVLAALPEKGGTGEPSGADELRVSTDDVAGWLEAHRDASAYGMAVRGAFGPGQGDVERFAIAAGQDVLSVDLADVDEKGTKALAAFLSGKSKKVVHDAKGAWHAWHGASYELNGVARDTMLSAYLLYPGQRTYDVGDLAIRHLGVEVNTPESAGQIPGLEAGDDQLARLAAVEVPLAQALDKELAKHGENGDLTRLELAVERALERMEATGIAVDKVKLDGMWKDFDSRVSMAAQEAYAAIGHEVNLASPKQLQAVLFDELGLPKTKKTKSGYTTNADALATLAEKIAAREDAQAVAGQQFLGALLAHREVTKLRQSVEGLSAAVQPDGRIHTTFQQAVAATGRLSSTEPNLQNIHARTEEGRQIRSVFIPGEGFEGLLTADYSQIEMRIMASLSRDEGLIEAFQEGEDLHSYVASLVYNIPEKSVTPAQRSKVKAMSYGLAYGLSSYGLAAQLHVPTREAQELMDAYFARFGNVRTYLNSLVEQAKRDGYTETILGRRRYLPELTSKNPRLRDAAERMALNAPIQGSAADVIKVAMVQVAAALGDAHLSSRILIQVHDELVLEVAPGEREAVEAIVRREMGSAYPLAVPLSVGVGYGTDWRAAAH